MFSQPFLNEGIFQSRMDYYYRMLGQGNPQGGASNAPNENLNLGQYIMSPASWASWNSSTSKMIISDAGKYKVWIDFRYVSAQTLNSFASGPQTFDLEYWVGGIKRAFQHTSSPSASNSFSTRSYYPDVGNGSTNETAPVAFSYTGVNGSVSGDAYYYHVAEYQLSANSEIFLKTATALAVGSGPIYYPSGHIKIKGLSLTIEKLT